MKPDDVGKSVSPHFLTTRTIPRRCKANEKLAAGYSGETQRSRSLATAGKLGRPSFADGVSFEAPFLDPPPSKGAKGAD